MSSKPRQKIAVARLPNASTARVGDQLVATFGKPPVGYAARMRPNVLTVARTSWVRLSKMMTRRKAPAHATAKPTAATVSCLPLLFMACQRPGQLSDGGHEARRLQPRRPAAVRCALLGRVVLMSPASSRTLWPSSGGRPSFGAGLVRGSPCLVAVSLAYRRREPRQCGW